MIRTADEVRERNLEREYQWNVCRRAAIVRDGWRCWGEVLTAHGWARCGKRSAHTAHVYKRNDCGEAWADLGVVVRLCYDCHRALHAARPNVRIPKFIQQRAWDALVLAHRENPPRLKVLPSGGRP